jgi:uncharacterized membrane protein
MASIHEAKAAMVFCNRTLTPIEAALGYREEENWVSEGWWQIEPGQCARVFGRPFTQRFYFYYGTALATTGKDKPPFVWSGKYEFCTDTKAFRVEGDGNCEAQGYQTRGFQQIDLGSNTRDYTLDFKDNDSPR